MSLSLLLVEDQPVNQKLALAVLGRVGLDAVLAQNGQQALERLRDASRETVILGKRQGDAVIEMNVSDQRHIRYPLANPAKRLGSLHRRHRNTHDIGTGGHATLDLGDRGINVTGFRVGHGLHRDRRIAANGDFANHDLTAVATRNIAPWSDG